MGKVPFYAKRFVSGTHMTQALEVVGQLNKQNVHASLDLLGENITSRAQAEQCQQEYLTLLQKIAAQKLDSHVSLKLTMLGLDIDEAYCFDLLSQILSTADDLGNRVALDMEGTAYTERTVKIYEAACRKFKSPELVLQAYLHRTPNDLDRVLAANGRFRLCKGAYKEKPEHALQLMPQIRTRYLELARKALQSCQHVCLATHDDILIAELKQIIEKENIAKEKYEFQMLYGLREKTWYSLAEQGHPFTVYVPYGEQWQAYFSRRLAERKENIFFVLRNLFKS